MNKENNPTVYLSFIKDLFSEDTGGGIECDVLHLEDGTILVISDEVIALYPDLDAWENRQESTLGAIFRAAAYPEQG